MKSTQTLYNAFSTQLTKIWNKTRGEALASISLQEYQLMAASEIYSISRFWK